MERVVAMEQDRMSETLKQVLTAMLLVVLLITGGCAQPLNKREKGVLVGGGLGAATGAIIGAAVGNPGAGAAIGGALGAVGGGLDRKSVV